MIVKLGTVAEEPVVPDVRGAPGDLAGARIGQERRDDELAFREGADRAEVDRRAVRCPRNDGSTATPTAGSATPSATTPPRPSVARSSRRLRGKRSASTMSLGFGGLGARGAVVVAAHPGESGQKGDRAAKRRDHQRADDQPDEQDCDADREADRPDPDSVRPVHQSARTAVMSRTRSTVSPTTTLPASSSRFQTRP